VSEPERAQAAAAGTREVSGTSDLPAGSLRIGTFTKREKGAVKAVITVKRLNAVDELAIFDESLAKLAEQVCQDGTPVYLDTKRSAKGSEYLKGLRRSEPVPVDHESIPYDDEVPFAWLMPFVLPLTGLIGVALWV
jgi:hypothetical protein